ncbi:hypothetical protein BFG06_11655 [Aeromonas caviae]|nr:hypothetical protein BFG06_11655 [Aeromonas caviae]
MTFQNRRQSHIAQTGVMITSLLKILTRFLQPLYLVMLTLLGHLSLVRIYPLLEMVRVLEVNDLVPSGAF